MSDPGLFSPYALDAVPLADRLVMAPRTRNRAGAKGCADYPVGPSSAVRDHAA